jgi:transcriptional regulator of acetoin/glycerol metabolism
MTALDELIERVKGCPLKNLPDVLAALEGRAKAPKTVAELEEMEAAMFRRALEAVAGNKSAAARELGVDRKTFQRRAERLGVLR